MNPTLSFYKNGFYAMATRFYILMPGMEDGAGDELFQKMKDEVNRIEAKLSRFIKESEISKINHKASQSAVKTDDECFEILRACKYGWQMTDGAFDITLRPLMDYWKKSGNHSDEEDELQNIKKAVGMQHVILDEQQQTVHFTSDIVELDFGAFGKGYALEKVKQILASSFVQNAFISFGESSVLGIGEHPAGGAWRIGINDYKNPGNSVYEFQVKDGSVSTSSNFYVDDDGNLQNHRHVINPETGKPHSHFTAASVSAPSPALAEILSTAVLLLPDEKIHNLIKKYEDIEVIKVNYEPDEPAITIF